MPSREENRDGHPKPIRLSYFKVPSPDKTRHLFIIFMRRTYHHDLLSLFWNFFFFIFQFDLVCDRGSFGFISTSVMFAGHFIGSLVVSPICDKFGRKIPLFVCGFLCCLLNFLSAFSPSFWVFALFRALVGFMIGECFS